MAALLALAACNPVETWRDWSGASRNDPDPDTTPNSKNLAAGEASDYPNLATVPPPPSRAMTAADREKLTQSLIADRANARYSDEQLRAGFSEAGTSPAPSLPAAEAGTAPPEPAAAAAAPVPKAAMSAPPPTPLAPAPPPTASSAASADAGSGGKSTAPPHAAASRSAQTASNAATGPAQGLRKQGEPPEPGPMESSLQVPQARATPQPEQIQPAPPPPQLPPPVATTAKPVEGGLAAGGVLAPKPLPEATAAAGFEPPPASPQLPPAPIQSAEATPAKGAPKPPAPVDKPVAEVKFAADSTSVSAGDRRTLETVVPLYQQNPGKVRIVGYAQAGNAAVEKLNSYRTALDRAQAVAAVLTKDGIPADKIEVEAAPAGPDSGESRAEVLLEH